MAQTPNAFGFAIDDFSSFLSPEPVYRAVSDAAGIWAALMPVILVLVFIIRFYSESARNLSGKARFQEATGDMFHTLIISFAYAAGGFLILKLLLTLSSYFYAYGSFSVIADEFSTLIADLKQKQESYDANFLESILGMASALTLPFSYLYFLITSSLFVMIHSFLRIAYAIYFGVIYLWGFIAIPSGALSGTMNLKNGWIKSMMLLAVWPILEATMYLFLKAIIIDASESVLTGYSASKLASFSVMHGLMGTICLLMTILSIAAAFMAIRLVSNQEALSGIVAPAVAAVTYVHKSMQDSGKEMMGSSMPNLKDGLGGGLSNINQDPVGSLKSGVSKVGSTAKGLGNAVTDGLSNAGSNQVNNGNK